MRTHDRSLEQMRPLEFQTQVTKYAEGSCLVKCGDTHVLCTASVEDQIPRWLMGKNEGWITAEYSMLPRSTHSRISRSKALSGGRSQEISRFIARALRSGFDLKKIPEKCITVDCDVLQADGGTRTAAISGGFVALQNAIQFLLQRGDLKESPISSQIAAVSLGKLNNQIFIDLDYDEDFQCDCDVNFVMNSENEFIEIQGTSERKTFQKEDFIQMMDLAHSTCQKIFNIQKKSFL